MDAGRLDLQLRVKFLPASRVVEQGEQTTEAELMAAAHVRNSAYVRGMVGKVLLQSICSVLWTLKPSDEPSQLYNHADSRKKRQHCRA